MIKLQMSSYVRHCYELAIETHDHTVANYDTQVMAFNCQLIAVSDVGTHL